MSATFAFQDAIVARLRADAALAALLGGGKVYDQPPGDHDRPRAPYVYIGAVNRTRIESSCGRKWTVRLRLFAVSTALGRKEAWAVIEAAGNALDGWEPTLAAGYSTDGEIIRVVQDGDVIEPLNLNEAFCDLACTLAAVEA